MKKQSTKLLVIGGGPAGYVAAIRAAQLGVPTILVEAKRLGGTCLNIGCIPSKALIHAADEYEKAKKYSSRSPLGIKVSDPSIDVQTLVKWKDGIVTRLTGGVEGLLKKNGANVVLGRATIVDGKTVDVVSNNGDETRIHCEQLLLATGSVATELPFLPFSECVVSSEQALSPQEIPERLVIVGAGYIGLELGTAYAKLGADVSIVEMSDRILPTYDDELTKPVTASLKKLGIKLHLGCSVTNYDETNKKVSISSSAGAFTYLPADKVLVAVGRQPNTVGYGRETLGLAMTARSVKVDNQCRTSMRGVWAIGDLTGEPMLAHRGMAQGEMVAEIIAGKTRRFAPEAIPAICFTDPEIVSVGVAPASTKTDIEGQLVSTFPFAANGRAMSLGATEGFVRVVARKSDHLIVGWQAVGVGISELAAAFSQSIEMGSTLEDVAGTIHAHPTLGEAVQEAALRALGHALHI
jgi:dihydrolipoamide dehydrogenase